MDHLAGGVDAGVGASGHGEADGLTHNGGQGGGEDPSTVRSPGWAAHPEKKVPS